MAEKVTVMVLKVDLQCPCCYKKVKKILCKFPQIRDQVYDEKGNKVTITVVCCSPEKIRDKLCYKGSRVIKSIEIKEPPKPKEPEKPKQSEKPKESEKPKQPEKPNVVVIEKPKQPEKPNVVVIEKPNDPEKPKVVTVEKPKEAEKPKETPKPKNVTFEKPKDAPKPKGKDAPPLEKPKEAPKPDPPKNPGPAPGPPNPGPPKMSDPIPFHVPAQGYPPAFPMQPCCASCYEGYGGGPCYQGYGVPPPPQPCYDDYYGYNPDYHGTGTHVTRCDYYLREENPQWCSIM